MRFPKLLVIACAGLVLAGAATWIAVRTDDGHADPNRHPGPTAVRASVFVAPTGSDGSPCTRRRPCASFERALRAARAGEVIEVAAGGYPSQELTSGGGRQAGKAVVFRPAAGAGVTLENLTVEGASFVKFRGFRVSEAVRVLNPEPSAPGSRHVVFERLRAQTVKIFGRVSDISVRGGVYGDTVDWQPQIGIYDRAYPDDARPRRIVIDGVTFRNYKRSGPDAHTECLQVLHVDGLVVRNSRFNNCDGTAALALTDGPSDNVTIENNFLGEAGDAYYSMQITKNVHKLVLRYNSATEAATFSDDESGGPYTVTANYMPFSSGLCVTEGTYSRNVFAGGRCGRADLAVRALRFADARGFDLHLASNSQAIDRGDPRSHPVTDIDRQRRPRDGAPDAGADERR